MDNDPVSKLKFLLPFLLLLSSQFLFANSSKTALELDREVDAIIDFAADEVKDRLQQLDQSLLEHRFDESVRRLIKYHVQHPRQTALNVGRAVAFFPIFEKELAAAGLPESLKYLPVIESSLRPWVYSRVGAVGLWQFMPGTAPEYGLEINEYVDERMDVLKSTQAAIRYLISAHEYLGDWSLAIAAYNAGKGRVNRAKRRSGGKNFWSVRRHLPRETRNYVPAFIAAIYLSEFYAAHDMEVEMPSFDVQLITSVNVYHPLSFYQLAQVTGLSIDLIQQMNPCYIKGFLPGREEGFSILIPKRVEPALREYLNNWATADNEPFLPWRSALRLPDYEANDEAYYQQCSWSVALNDSLENIAEYTDFTTSQLAIWNRLSPLDSLVENQEISYYRPVVYKYLPKRDKSIVPFIDNNRFLESVQQKSKKPYVLPASATNNCYFFLTQKEKLSTIIDRFAFISLEEILQVNSLSNNRMLPAGFILKVPRK